MNWNKNPPPPGVNPEYSSFHYNTGRFESEAPRHPVDDYSHKPGRPGGGWDAEEEVPVIRSSNRPDAYSSRPQPSFKAPAEFHVPAEAPREAKGPEHRPAMAVREQAGEYEKTLVEDITIPGGVRPRPSDKDMHEFVAKCKYLSPEIVMGLLVHLLENSQRAFVRDM